MVDDADARAGLRDPDPRALRILLNTFWSAGGWHNRPEDHVTPDDFSFAVGHGLMFEPRHLTHDEAVAEAIAAHASVTPRFVANAFVVGLASRRVDLRSGLGSYAATMHLAEHAYVPWMGRGPSCEVCGFGQASDVDLNVLSFERFKWGGVRHFHMDYAAFDLQQLPLWFAAPDDPDTAILVRLLERWRRLPGNARARQAADAGRGLFPSNDDQRRTVVQIASIAGVLQPVALRSMLDEHVPYIDRDRSHPGGRNDWDYPAFGWTGSDGVNEEAAARWWGSAVARRGRVRAAPIRTDTRDPAPPTPAKKRRPTPQPSAAEPDPKIRYPFVPKSNRLLTPGQFWGIPLSNGRYACGRVLEIDREPPYGKRTSFLAGLMDWTGDRAPTTESIAGRPILDQGETHFRTILETGEGILGHRPLEADGLEPLLCLSAHVGGNLQCGLRVLRPATREEQERLPVLSAWGLRVISMIAEQHFVTGRIPPRLRIP